MKWTDQVHERKVENFYSSGVTKFHEYHGGYLSFGYWKEPGINYIQAAENLLDLLCSHLNMGTGSILLDIGCGMGSQDVYIAKKIAVKKIEAIDATGIHIQISKSRAEKNNIPSEKITFTHATALAVPFPDNTFSHILSVEAPEHFNTREKFFYEAYRVLQPGGVIVMSDYSLNREPKQWIEKIMVRLVAWLWRVPKDNLYGNFEYKIKMEKAGFINITIENIGRNVIPGYYFEHQRPEQRKEIKKVRGFWLGVVGGFIIDWFIYKVFNLGLCEYIIVRAEKCM